MANDESGGGGPTDVVLLVCMTCGREYQYDSGSELPSELECEKCGGEVFRRFDDAAVPDEVQADFREATERDLDPTDAEGDATRGDLHDLNP